MLGNLISLKRWHWMVIALFVGLAVGNIARPTSLDLRTEYGTALNSQKDFEIALVKEAEGRRRFKDIVVHHQSAQNPAGGEQRVWIVSGLYCTGMPNPTDGKLYWTPAFFVAGEPYRPATDLPQLAGSSSAAVADFQKLQYPTILDFLHLLADTRAVEYRHAWWRSYSLAVWFIASVLLIGIVWPTAIDLIVFGKLIRPREKKPDLSLSSTPQPLARPQMSAEERAKLEALDAEMAAKLAAEPLTVPAAIPGPATAKPAPILQAGPQAAVKTPEKKPRAFGAGAEDFYPTEQKAKTAKVEKQG
jgi:hypothetical protein